MKNISLYFFLGPLNCKRYKFPSNVSPISNVFRPSISRLYVKGVHQYYSVYSKFISYKTPKLVLMIIILLVLSL